MRPIIPAALGAFLWLAICAHAESGTVVDEATGKPLEGVVVVAQFYGSTVAPAHSSTRCYHLDVAVSDAQGRFDIDLFSGNFAPWLTDRRRGLAYYKAGYEQSPGPARTTADVRMRPFKGSVEERFRKHLCLPMMGTQCPESGNALLPLAKAMAAEAEALATTVDQKELAAMFRFEVDSRTVDRETALRSHEGRLSAIHGGRRPPARMISPCER